MADEPERRRPRWGRRLIILFLVLCIPILLYSIFGRRRPVVEPGSVLVVRMEGQLAEAPSGDPLKRLAHTLGQSEGAGSLHELRRALTRARTDGRIAGVLLEVHPVQMGWAQVDEVSALVADLRAAGKPVTALLAGDFVEEKEYSLALPAGRVLANPEAGLLLNGVLAEVTFLRGLLDNLKVEPQVLQFKEYKSAGEQLVNRQMSPAMREVVTDIATGAYERFISQVVAQRKLDRGSLQALLSRGLLTTKEALAAKLLDGVGYRDTLIQELLKEPDRGDERREKSKVVPVARYLKALPDEPQAGDVALIYAVGPIISGLSGGGLFGSEVIEGEKLAKALREAVAEERIKAIVMRVDSPGGFAVGSDFVWREIQRAKGKKPVVVSMSTVAGSGGYWISMGADKIVAQPTTLTGSIGVIALHVNVLPFLNWIGATVDTVKLGDNADLMSPYRNWSPEHQARMSAWMGQVYSDFVSRVAQGRGLTEAVVEPIARGRVWTGAQAKDRRLVDELGGLRDALRIARVLAKLPEDPTAEPVVFPRQQGLMAILTGATQAWTRRPPDLETLVREQIRALGIGRPSLTAPTIDLR